MIRSTRDDISIKATDLWRVSETARIRDLDLHQEEKQTRGETNEFPL